jgi:hypothetical protein
MSFLDRFKPQPRWKNADPAIRAAAVADIPRDDEHLGVLRELARDDSDTRVRRAAGARLIAVEDVVQLARTERDEEVRRGYVERLVSIATAAADNDAAASLALEGIDDQKHFATIARSSPHDTVRAAALGRIHDAKLLGAVARQAEDPQTAADAVARIADGAELLNIAIKTEHKDAGVSALDRAIDAGAGGNDLRDVLDGVANRAKSKGVARRARALIQTLDEEEAARRAALEQWQQRVAAVVARVEAIAAAPGTDDAAARLADAEEEWRAVTADGRFELDSDATARFDSLVEQTRNEFDRLAREEAERRAARERQEAIARRREELCERLEQARAEDALDEIDRARGEWEGMKSNPDAPATPALDARFDAACDRAAERHRRREEIARLTARLEELSARAEELAAQEPFNEGNWAALGREWNSARLGVEQVDEPVAQRFAAAEEKVRQRAEERRAAAERALRQQVQRVEQLIERATKRTTAEDLTLREADRISRDLKIAVETPPLDLPRAEQQVLIDRLRVAHGALSPKLHELREMDEWKRFANAAVQEELIARAEALREKYPFDRPDQELTPEQLEDAAQELHLIQERWKQAADAPRAQAQALWHRYRQASDPVQARVREFYSQRAEERGRNLLLKTAMIERAEALADSTDWIKTAEEFKKLQAEWQAIGAVPRQESRATWKRFRDACDKFFTRRNADLAQRKEVWATNFARKEVLCARAEELCKSMNWESAAAEMRRMQAEWKTIGPVRRNKSEAIWQRFRTAADTFFDRYKHRDQIELEAKQADREALVAEVEALAEHASAAEPAATLEQVRSLRTRWNQSTPVVRQGADPLSARFMSAVDRLITGTPDAFRGTELDIEANRQRMEKLIGKVEGFLTDAATPANSSEALATMLREALASNTIGGRAAEESKWKAMAEDVRQAQASWSRLGPVPGDTGRELADRFHKACNKFFEQYRRKVPPTEQRRGKPVGAR